MRTQIGLRQVGRHAESDDPGDILRSGAAPKLRGANNLVVRLGRKLLEVLSQPGDRAAEIPAQCYLTRYRIVVVLTNRKLTNSPLLQLRGTAGDDEEASFAAASATLSEAHTAAAAAAPVQPIAPGSGATSGGATMGTLRSALASCDALSLAPAELDALMGGALHG